MTGGRITLDRAEHLDLLRRCGDAEERGQSTAKALFDLAIEADAHVRELERQLAERDAEIARLRAKTKAKKGSRR